MPKLVNRLAAVLATSLFCFASTLARAQDSDHAWHKEYAVASQPTLTLETSDAELDIHSCGDCKSIHIQVHTNQKLSEYRLEEHQDGNRVSFLLKDKPHVGFHINWNMTEKTEVTVETPGSLDLEARTGDGSVSARDLTGNLQLHSGDGNVILDRVHGALTLTAADGNIEIHNATGSLDARSSDGRMKIDGQFTAVQLHTSDGNLEFNLSPGSRLASASRIESSDGQVSIHVPHDLSADLDVSTSDGKVDCSLPLTLDHYNSGQHLHGRLNAGGVPLTIHTSDGNVTIAAL